MMNSGPTSIIVACLLALPLSGQTVQAEPERLMQEIPGFPPAVWDLGWNSRGRDCEVTRHVALVDVDADADLDLVVGPLHGKQGRLYLNDGHGRLTNVSATHMPSLDGGVWQIATGDIDGDGDVDLVFPLLGHPANTQFFIFINDGLGRFTDQSVQRLPPPQTFPYTDNDSAVLADFDGDGDLDLVRSGGTYNVSYQYSARMLTNDGTGHFTDAPNAFPMDGGIRSGHSGILRTADIDADGDIDIVGNTLNGGIACWLNDGTGVFTDGAATNFHPPPFSYVFADVQLGDVDRDGDLDLIGARGYMRNYPLLYLNDGTGNFHDVTATQIPIPSIGGIALRFGDLDDDGDLDFVSNVPFRTGRPPAIPRYLGEEVAFLNDGSGNFKFDLEGRIFPRIPNGANYDCALGDLDNDGDLDAILPDLGAGFLPICRMRYYSNTVRHLHATTRPTRGEHWQLTVHGPKGGIGFVAVAPRTANTPIPPHGTLALDPASLVVWPNPVTFGAERRAPLYLPIPQLPALAGAPLYSQGLVIDRTGNLRMTNLWIEGSIH